MNGSGASLGKRCAAEFVGTFVLVFTGVGATIVNRQPEGSLTSVGVAASFGLAVMVAVYAVGHISGAHINPAVSLAFAASRHFPVSHVVPYWLAQFAGAILASSAWRWFRPADISAGITRPIAGLAESYAMEIAIAAILMFVTTAMATDTRAVGQAAAIAIGATVGMQALVAGPVSGGSMNPARSLGPAFAAADFKSIWIYLTAPGLGCLLGAFAYRLIRPGTSRH